MRLIDADALEKDLFPEGTSGGFWGFGRLCEMLDRQPTVEAIPKGAYEQVKWECDMAVQQLNDYGVQLGEKADLQAVVRCKDCRRERYCEFTQYQGMNGYCSLAESKDGD